MSKTEELELKNLWQRKIRRAFDPKIRTLVFNPHGDPVKVRVTDPNGERYDALLGKGSIITSFGPTTVQPTKVPTLLRITTHNG